MINRLSNPVNRNRSAAKISKVMSFTGHKDCCEPVYETASAHPFPQDTNSKLVDSSAEVVLVELVGCSVHPFPPVVQLTQM